jgi:hypothetical protein
MHFHAERRVDHPSFTVQLYTGMGTLITETSTTLHGLSIPYIGPGSGRIDLQLAALNLIPDRYSLTFSVSGGTDGRFCDADVRAFLDVEPSAAYGTAQALNSRFGIVYFPQRWTAPVSQ